MPKEQAAAEEIRLVRRYYRKNPGYLGAEAVISFRRGNFKKALKWFKRALKLDFYNASFHFDQALTFERLGETDAAAGDQQPLSSAGRSAEPSTGR